MKSLLPLTILAALAVAALCYGEKSFPAVSGAPFPASGFLSPFILPAPLLSPFSVITQRIMNPTLVLGHSTAPVLILNSPMHVSLKGVLPIMNPPEMNTVLPGVSLHTWKPRYSRNVSIPSPCRLL